MLHIYKVRTSYLSEEKKEDSNAAEFVNGCVQPPVAQGRHLTSQLYRDALGLLNKAVEDLLLLWEQAGQREAALLGGHGVSVLVVGRGMLRAVHHQQVLLNTIDRIKNKQRNKCEKTRNRDRSHHWSSSLGQENNIKLPYGTSENMTYFTPKKILKEIFSCKFLISTKLVLYESCASKCMWVKYIGTYPGQPQGECPLIIIVQANIL